MASWSFLCKNEREKIKPLGTFKKKKNAYFIDIYRQSLIERLLYLHSYMQNLNKHMDITLTNDGMNGM